MKSIICLIPNGLTISRMAGAIILLFLPPMTTPFILIYILCGVTDVLDGFSARTLHLESQYGARLDGTADALFIFACLVKLLPFFHLPLWVWIWCAIITAIKGSTLFLTYKKYKEIGYQSIWNNKIAGCVLFLAPLFALKSDIRFIAVIVGAVTTFAAIRERKLT